MRNFILLPLLCLSVFATAQTLKDTVARLDSFFAAHSVGDSTPGGVLMISRNGQILYKKYMGLASLEHKTPITENTVFEAASVSKQFTATSILLLAREGRISLDDDVRKYIPQLPDYGETIRIHHLLTHTSGLKDWRNITYISGWPTGKRLYNQSMALDMICKQKSLNFMPGERYSYSNSGYDLLAVIVEKVSGMKFKDFVGERLLKLAGMNQSFFRPAHEQIIPHMASSYIQQNDQSYIHPLILDESYGAAGLITNATDLHKWVLFIEKGGLSEDIKKLRSTRFVLNNGDTITYALGGVHVMHRDNLIPAKRINRFVYQ
jgi:CubicO group peptidase (beta-lactamase class C family)